MDRMAHDVTEVLPRAGRDFQQALFLNTFQQVNEMMGFKLRDGQMTNYRKDMVVHAGKQTVSGVLRPLFIVFMPCQRHCFKHLLWCAGSAFRSPLLCRVDVQRQHLTDTFALLAGIRQGDGRIGTQCNAGFFAVYTIFKIPVT